MSAMNVNCGGCSKGGKQANYGHHNNGAAVGGGTAAENKCKVSDSEAAIDESQRRGWDEAFEHEIHEAAG